MAILNGIFLALSSKNQKHMRAYLFFLLLLPIILVAQEQPINGSTDCPTFGKKNVSSKAGIFQYMRTHKPQRKDIREQPLVYQTSALPDLKKAQEDREAKKRNNQPAVAKKQRPAKVSEAKKEAVIIENAAPPEEEVAIATPEKKEENITKTEDDKEASDEGKDSTIPDAKEKRDKKLKKAARQAKVQRIFKTDKKRSSRKNVQKCPSF